MVFKENQEVVTQSYHPITHHHSHVELLTNTFCSKYVVSKFGVTCITHYILVITHGIQVLVKVILTQEIGTFTENNEKKSLSLRNYKTQGQKQVKQLKNT